MIEVLVLVGSEFLVKEPASHVSALLHDRTLSEAAPDVRHASGRLARSLLVYRDRWKASSAFVPNVEGYMG